MISAGIGSVAFKKAISQPDPNLDGLDIDVVRLRNGVSPAVGLLSLQRIATKANEVMAADPEGQGDVYQVVGVQRPAEIVNYQSTGATPGILAAGLAVARSWPSVLPWPPRSAVAAATLPCSRHSVSHGIN